jgi:hypothetical protein
MLIASLAVVAEYTTKPRTPTWLDLGEPTFVACGYWAINMEEAEELYRAFVECDNAQVAILYHDGQTFTRIVKASSSLYGMHNISREALWEAHEKCVAITKSEVPM